ncbi:hypothetical protein EK21DRAFT_84622 [Setomelanomma holmii]|uniref:BTB domain-containing protein n=1 Tax=Setomelanomma holmii TaxID=210430 RepID=A0A9P4LPY6_9PLEO|nr:hypothetical protein EK21DRAFT_84622 [Setomelanomma holmii]
MTDSDTDEPQTGLVAPGDAPGEGLVTVEIGPDLKQFYIHKALLVRHSEYFAKALPGPWIEAQENVITLDNVGEDIFELFVHWLYNQKIHNDIMGHIESLSRCPGFEDLDIICYARAYGFGDRILASDFQRLMNSELVDHIRNCWEVWFLYSVSDTIVWAFENIPSDRPVLQLMVDRFYDF